MNYQELVQRIVDNLVANIRDLHDITNDSRRILMQKVLFGTMAYGLLVLGHILIAIFADYPRPGAGITAAWGVLWALVLGYMLITRGEALHYPFLIMQAGRDKAEEQRHDHEVIRTARAIARLLVAYFAVALLTDMVFISVPFHASPAIALVLMIPVGAFFLLRWLANEEIKWKTLVPLCSLAIYLQAGNLYYIYYEGKQPSLAEPMYWTFGALLYLLLAGSEHGKGTFQWGAGLVILAVGIGLHFGVQDRIYPPQDRLASDLSRIAGNKFAPTADVIKQLYDGNIITAEEAADLAKKADSQLKKDQARFRTHQGPGYKLTPTHILVGAMALFVILLVLPGIKKAASHV